MDDLILFYDGECGLCNNSIRYVLRHDSRDILKFAPLQGSTAEKALKGSGLPADIGQSTIVLYDHGQYLIRSRAAIGVMRSMGGYWKKLAGVLGFIPAPLSDLVYRLIAQSRGLFPRKTTCEMLQPEQRSRFLP